MADARYSLQDNPGSWYRSRLLPIPEYRKDYAEEKRKYMDAAFDRRVAQQLEEIRQMQAELQRLDQGNSEPFPDFAPPPPIQHGDPADNPANRRILAERQRRMAFNQAYPGQHRLMPRSGQNPYPGGIVDPTQYNPLLGVPSIQYAKKMQLRRRMRYGQTPQRHGWAWDNGHNFEPYHFQPRSQ